MKTKKEKFSAEKASSAILREMVIKFGVKFMCDFDDVKRGTPLYIVLYETRDGEISPSPMFPSLEIAETFVAQCIHLLPGFKKKNFRICKVTAA